MTIDILWMGGTSFGNGGDGISEEFRRQLEQRAPGSLFRFRYVGYPGDYGLRYAYVESVAIGEESLLKAIADSPNLVIVGGYSQGAEVAANVGVRVYLGERPDLEVLGCLLIADPRRPRGAGHPIGPSDGYGVLGERDLGDLPTLWAANVGDPITDLPEGNPLRTIADISEFMAAGVDPDRAVDLFLKVQRMVSEGRTQRWWDWKNWRTWGGALAYARGYLFDGRHTTDYITRGLCANLAQAVVNRNWTP